MAQLRQPILQLQQQCCQTVVHSREKIKENRLAKYKTHFIVSRYANHHRKKVLIGLLAFLLAAKLFPTKPPAAAEAGANRHKPIH